MCKKTVIAVVVIATVAVGGYLYFKDHNFDWSVTGNTVSSSSSASHTEEKAHEHQEHKFNNNGTLTISNVNGNIHINTHSDNTLVFDATKKGDSSDFNKIETKTDISESSASIAAHYHGNNVHASIDYDVTVPEGTVIESATNVNGNVHIDNTTKRITARTTNGNVIVSPQKISNIVTLTATNGTINLKIPNNTHATVHANTAVGSITSSYPLTIDKTSPVGRKASGDIGKGGVPITLETTNGSISIN